MTRKDVIQAARIAARGYRFLDPGGPAMGKAGFHGSALAGSSLEYKDFREYRPGDDLRHLDWGAFARSDKLIVKRYHDEVTPHLDLLVDVSRSMDLPQTQKGAASLFHAVFLTAVALQSRYSCRVWLVGERCEPLSGDVREDQTWEALKFDSAASSGSSVQGLLPKLKRHGLRVFITDTLWPQDPKHLLGSFVAASAAAFIIRPLAQDEVTPPLGGHVRLQDSETGEQQQIRMDKTTIQAYKTALDRHLKAWEEASRQTGVAIHGFQAEAFMGSKDLGSLLGRLLAVG